MKTMEEWWKELNQGSVWQHSGNPRAPHVVLRRRKHSDIFVNTLQYLTCTKNLGQAAITLAKKLKSTPGFPTKIDSVFGSPMAGIPLATLVAVELWATNVFFTEKKADGELFCRFDVPPECNAVFVEEEVSTGGTPQRVVGAVRERNPDIVVVPFIGVFLTRCGTKSELLPKMELVPIIDLREIGVVFNEWEPKQCPLCAEGSRPIENCKDVWKDLLLTTKDPNHPIPRLDTSYSR